METIDLKLNFGSVTLKIQRGQFEIHQEDFCQIMNGEQFSNEAARWSDSIGKAREEWTVEHIRIFLLYLANIYKIGRPDGNLT